MNLYFELLKTPVFTVEDVNKHYDNMDSARSAIKRLMKEGMVAKILGLPKRPTPDDAADALAIAIAGMTASNFDNSLLRGL